MLAHHNRIVEFETDFLPVKNGTIGGSVTAAADSQLNVLKLEILEIDAEEF